ncbi:MAG: 5'-3' exonuclease H3TH domain-containing protein [Sandaracinaceae bacterium]
MKVHLLDGTYELFRMFFGAPPTQGPTGNEVGATRALMRSLTALLAQDDVTHVGVAFDHVVESFRNRLFDGYKTGEGIDPDLFGQFELAERAVRALGVVVWPMVEYEADDALATAAARFASDEAVSQVILASPDKDLCQCVRGDRVVLWDRRRDIVLDADGVKAKHGVPPASIPDYLALVGDAADGIPGIARWGAKSTAQVLSAYGTVEAIPDDVSEWSLKVRGGATLAQNLAGQREDAMLYKLLATLVTDVPLTETLDDMRWKGPDAEALAGIATELSDPGLPSRVPG